MFNQKVHVACHFGCLIKAEGPLNPQGHRQLILRKCGNISETVSDRDVLTTDHY